MEFNCLRNESLLTKDVIIVTAPLTDTAIPLMAPAVLKPIVEKAGFSCLAADLNAEIFNLVKAHPKRAEVNRFFYENWSNEETEAWFHEMFTDITTQLLSFNPKVICISVFSYVCQVATKWMCYYIKKSAPQIKIFIGGAGCMNAFTGPSPYVDELLESGLIDYHVRGDGEHSLYELLLGNDKFPGINSLEWKNMTNEDLTKIPMPDYSNYNFSVYEKRVLPLLGSRGCVRQCTFCDYIANWKKFQWRKAEDIFNEMVEQHRRYNISTFQFQDSLTNGSLKEFRRLCELLTDYNKNNATPFRWSGYYIFREWNDASVRDWELVAGSGAEILAVGIENLNQDIRYAIGKKFSDESITLHIQQAQKHKITLQLLNIVGYVNETRQHIDRIRQWLYDHTQYQDTINLQWGGTLGIFPNTYLESHKEELGIKMIGTQPQQWINPTTDSTPELRAQWVKELTDLSEELGYNVLHNLVNHYVLESIINA